MKTITPWHSNYRYCTFKISVACIITYVFHYELILDYDLSPDISELCYDFVLQPIENPSDNAMEFARRRLRLGENLYYKMLEKILVSEQQRISAAVSTKSIDFSVGSSHYIEGMCFMFLTFIGILLNVYCVCVLHRKGNDTRPTKLGQLLLANKCWPTFCMTHAREKVGGHFEKYG